eukprot:4527945-Amphidinium_carterae.2
MDVHNLVNHHEGVLRLGTPPHCTVDGLPSGTFRSQSFSNIVDRLSAVARKRMQDVFFAMGFNKVHRSEFLLRLQQPPR